MPKTFKPLCLAKRGEEDYTEIAVTNRNQLLPCCHLDSPGYYKDPFIKKLAESSDISKHKSLEDIINSEEWKTLNRVLTKAMDTQDTKDVPPPCVDVCTKVSRTAEWLIGEGGQ
jgi:hypothetical protein|tara:strand:+ start:288 stop:629 length:342 start_codon:yes stop_codon:yes gene_type:complete